MRVGQCSRLRTVKYIIMLLYDEGRKDTYIIYVVTVMTCAKVM